MRVSDIMHTPVVTVQLDDALREVYAIFEAHVVHYVMVVEDEKLVGLIGEPDLLRAISPYIYTHVYTTRDWATLQQRVHQIVHRHPLRLRQDASVKEAIALFMSSAVDCIPIVDEDDVPVGMVTKTDIIRHLRVICADPHNIP